MRTFSGINGWQCVMNGVRILSLMLYMNIEFVIHSKFVCCWVHTSISELILLIQLVFYVWIFLLLFDGFFLLIWIRLRRLLGFSGDISKYILLTIFVLTHLVLLLERLSGLHLRVLLLRICLVVFIRRDGLCVKAVSLVGVHVLLIHALF